RLLEPLPDRPLRDALAELRHGHLGHESISPEGGSAAPQVKLPLVSRIAAIGGVRTASDRDARPGGRRFGERCRSGALVQVGGGRAPRQLPCGRLPGLALVPRPPHLLPPPRPAGRPPPRLPRGAT